MKITDKDKLAPLLRSYKLGHVDFEFTIDYILKLYKNSKIINNDSFMKGMWVGAACLLIWFKIYGII